MATSNQALDRRPHGVESESPLVRDALAYLSERLGLMQPVSSSEELITQLTNADGSHGEIAAFQVTPADIQRLALEVAIVRSLEFEPLEDGEPHDAQGLMIDALRRNGGAGEWIASIFWDNLPVRPELSADILRCVARLPALLSRDWGMPLALTALRSEFPDVRESAGRALEHWGGPEALSAIRAQAAQEPEPWLRAYLNRIARHNSTGPH